VATTDFCGTTAPSEPGVVQKAKKAAHDVKDFAKSKAQQARHVTEQTTDEVIKFVAARPVESVLVGAAVGYLLGWVAASAIHQRLRERQSTTALRSLPSEHEQLVRVREWPRSPASVRR
jgi:hypothetical protein